VLPITFISLPTISKLSRKFRELLRKKREILGPRTLGPLFLAKESPAASQGESTRGRGGNSFEFLVREGERVVPSASSPLRPEQRGFRLRPDILHRDYAGQVAGQAGIVLSF